MNWPPMLVHIKVENKHHWFSFWVPLFLMYPVILAIFLVLTPLLLLALIVLVCMGWQKLVLMAMKAPLVAFWNLRGFKVDIKGRNEVVFISVV
jgi:hypothetical protein